MAACSDKKSGNHNVNESVKPFNHSRFAFQPWAILQAGQYPLWFQFKETGPVLLETIDDAVFSSALVPWPYAPHVKSFLAKNNDLLMAVNRFGFICFVLSDTFNSAVNNENTGLYLFPEGDYWQQYSVDAFFISGENPAALLYNDDRFNESDLTPPLFRLWTFDYNSPAAVPFLISSLDEYSAEEGWNIDGLRRGNDGRWYFRATKKDQSRPEILLLGCDDIMIPANRVSQGIYRNAAMPETFSSFSDPLEILLETLFLEAGFKSISVVSPLFDTVRVFAKDNETFPVFGFFSENYLIASSAGGNAFYCFIKDDLFVSVKKFNLPSLPENFVYTGIGLAGETIIASWEEQEGYSIGAAGLMIVKLNKLQQ